MKLPRWRKEIALKEREPYYQSSFKTKTAAILASQVFTRSIITSMPRTKKHRIFQLWIYP